MAFIVSFEKSRRHPGEPLIYVSRDLGGTMLLLPWFSVTIHRGDWWVREAPARPKGFDAFLTGADQG